jgi:hypothetical protein
VRRYWARLDHDVYFQNDDLALKGPTFVLGVGHPVIKACRQKVLDESDIRRALEIYQSLENRYSPVYVYRYAPSNIDRME